MEIQRKILKIFKNSNICDVYGRGINFDGPLVRGLRGNPVHYKSMPRTIIGSRNLNLEILGSPLANRFRGLKHGGH